MTVKRIQNEDGLDVTEGIQVIFDGLMGSMDAGSGFLDWREWCAIRQVAWALGVLEGRVEEEVNARTQKFTGEHEMAWTTWPTTLGEPQQYKKPIYRNINWPDPAAPLTDAPPNEEDMLP